MNDRAQDAPELTRILLDEVRLLRKEMTSFRGSVNEDIMEIKEAIAALKALKSDVHDIKNRLNQLENVDVGELDRRLDKLEKDAGIAAAAKYAENIEDLSARLKKVEESKARSQGVSAGVGVLSGGGISALIQWLLSGS